MTKMCFLLVPFLLLASCGRDAYYQAVKEQNITTQLRIKQDRLEEEDRRDRHEERMVSMLGTLTKATSKTDTPTDDLMATVLFMSIQDKHEMTELARTLTRKDYSPQPIEAPETAGEFVQKTGGTILGVGALALGIVQSNNITDIAKTGIKNAGVSVSGESSYTEVSGEGSIVSEPELEETEFDEDEDGAEYTIDNPSGEYDDDNY